MEGTLLITHIREIWFAVGREDIGGEEGELGGVHGVITQRVIGDDLTMQALR